MMTFVRSQYSRLKRITGLCVLTVLTQPSLANMDDVSWHGFVSQGVIKTSDNSFFGDSEDTSWEFTDIGVGASWRPIPTLNISAQGIYRQAGETSPDDINLDYGFINYTAVNNMETGIGVRLGRIKNPYGFYNETRDIASTRPSVLLPESIYQDAFRDLFHSSDSWSLYGYREFGNTVVNVDLASGKLNLDEQSEALLVPGADKNELENDELLVVRTMLEYDGGRIRGGFSYVRLEGDINAAPLTPPALGITSGSLDITLRLWSFEYNWELWQFTTEYQRGSVGYFDIFGAGFRSTSQAESYYVQTSYQLTDKWRLLGRYDVLYPDMDDKSSSFAKDFTISARYEFNPSWMIAGEIHFVDGTAWLPSVENPNSSELEERWNLYTLQVSYKF